MAIEERKRKKGTTYTVKVRDQIGRWYEARSFERRVDAEREERRLLILKDEGRWAAPRAERAITLAEYWMRWSQEARSEVSAGWKMSQDQMTRDFILPVLGSIKLKEIKPAHVAKLLTETERQKYATATRRHIYVLLHKILEDAMELFELITYNPVIKKLRPRIESKARSYMGPDEARLFLSKVEGDWIAPAIWIGMLSGLRPGEIQALQVKHLDFQNNEIQIRRSFNRKEKRIQNHPKQKDAGLAPMPSDLAEFLKARVSGRSDEDFVIPAAGGGMLSYHTFHHALKRLCEIHQATPITPHELRHSCTELYMERGASEEDVRRLLNHKSSASTKLYIHRTNDRLSGIAATVSARPPESDLGTETFQGLRVVK